MNQEPAKHSFKETAIADTKREILREVDRLVKPVTRWPKVTRRLFVALSFAIFLSVYFMVRFEGGYTSPIAFIGLLLISPILSAVVTYTVLYCTNTLLETVAEFRDLARKKPKAPTGQDNEQDNSS